MLFRSGTNLITCESELHGWESRMPCPILSHMGTRVVKKVGEKETPLGEKETPFGEKATKLAKKRIVLAKKKIGTPTGFFCASNLMALRLKI